MCTLTLSWSLSMYIVASLMKGWRRKRPLIRKDPGRPLVSPTCVTLFIKVVVYLFAFTYCWKRVNLLTQLHIFIYLFIQLKPVGSEVGELICEWRFWTRKGEWPIYLLPPFPLPNLILLVCWERESLASNVEYARAVFALMQYLQSPVVL